MQFYSETPQIVLIARAPLAGIYEFNQSYIFWHSKKIFLLGFILLILRKCSKIIQKTYFKPNYSKLQPQSYCLSSSLNIKEKKKKSERNTQCKAESLVEIAVNKNNSFEDISEIVSYCTQPSRVICRELLTIYSNFSMLSYYVCWSKLLKFYVDVLHCPQHFGSLQ